MNKEDNNPISGVYNKGDITFEKIIHFLKNNSNIGESGSILTFTGIVRNKSKDGIPVKELKIDAYDQLANKTIEQICNEIKKFEGINEVIIVHLKGKFRISEDLVYVIIASSHREEGFNALRLAVERYKAELPVWKKELLNNGNSAWIH